MKFSKVVLSVLSILAISLSFSANTHASLLLNAGFENNTAGSYAIVGGGDSLTIAGWTTIHNGVELYTTTSAYEGDYVVDLNNYVFPSGGIEQTFATEIGKTYTISFAASTLQVSGRNGFGQVDVNIGNDFHSYTLENHTANYVWNVYTIDYTAVDTATTLSFSNQTDPFLNFSVIDGVSAELKTVPVPAALWLLISSLCMPAFFHKRNA